MPTKRSILIPKGEPARKKRAIADKQSPSKPKPSVAPQAKSGKVVRKAPITGTQAEASDTSDDEDEPETMEDINDRGNEDGLPVKSAPKNANAARESHANQKVLLSQRRAAKPNSALLAEAKRVWSLARQKNIPTAERQKYVKELMNAIKGKVQDVVFKHDASRIVQTIVKRGGKSERDHVASELKGKYVELAQNKYSKFLVTKLIRYCPKHRAAILSEFQGHVMRLLLHREASPVLADAFELYCNATERTLLMRDFYGKEVALFNDTAGAKSLEGVLKEADPERRKRVLVALKENLINIFNNPDKGAIPHAIVHRALWEYLREVNNIENEEERDSTRREIFESCQELIADMVHTKDGSRSVREFLARGSAKDRKQIIKTLKPHLERMCLDEEAQLVLFTALDVIDDTKMMSKSVITDMISHSSTLTPTGAGRRALLYLIVPRSPRHFTPAMISLLSATDAARSQTSKKDVVVRENEIRTAASPGLLDIVTRDAESLCRDPGGSLLVGEIMLYAEGDKSSATESLLKLVRVPYSYPPDEADSPHVIDMPHTSRLFKTLIQGGHFDRSTSTVSVVPTFSAGDFARAFVRSVGKENLVGMAKGNGAFIVVESLDKVDATGTEEEKRILRNWFDEDVKKAIGEGKGKGGELLLTRLKAIKILG